MIDIRRADELGEEYRRSITAVLVGGFADDFAYFSTDPAVLTDAFAHMLLLDRFSVALVDGEPAAVASVTTGDQECFAPDRREFQRHLGRWHGAVSYLIVRSQFLGAPDGAGPDVVEIGFVTTAPAYQGAGVATALLSTLLQLPYAEFVLRDIKNTNAPALGLYRKLGFATAAVRPVRFARRAGFASYVTMRLRSGRPIHPSPRQN